MEEYTLVTQWIINHGVSEQILKILVAISIVATIVSITRYVFGIKSYGIYVPVILAISYSYTGLRYGLSITLIVIATTLLSYSFLSKIRMHYITRIAINYCILAIVLILSIVAINEFGLGLENISNIPALALIAIASLSDFFIKQYVKKSLKSTIRSLFETLLISTLGWFLITRALISDYLINNIWSIPLLALVNLLIGQVKTLRIKEYLRFKSVTKEND